MEVLQKVEEMLKPLSTKPNITDPLEVYFKPVSKKLLDRLGPESADDSELTVVVQSGFAKGGFISVDLCFVMDCTGSMGAWIEAAKKNVIDIAKAVEKEIGESSAVNFRCSFVGYRDFKDTLGLEQIAFTAKVEDVKLFLEGDTKSGKQPITASGGGDEPEDMLGGLEAADKLEWVEDRPGLLKVICLVADAPCHGPEFLPDMCHDDFPKGQSGAQDQSTRADAVLKSLHSKNTKLWFLPIRPDRTNPTINGFNKRYNKEIVTLGALGKATVPEELKQNITKQFGIALAQLG